MTTPQRQPFPATVQPLGPNLRALPGHRLDVPASAPLKLDCGVDLAPFTKVRGTSGAMSVGDRYIIEITGPWKGAVEVVEVSSRSFRLATLEGHMESGVIEMRTSTGATGSQEGDVVFTIDADGTEVTGSILASATADNDSPEDLAADVAAALNDALRDADLDVTIEVGVSGDDCLEFSVAAATELSIDFTATTADRLQYRARGAIVELRFESPQVVAERTGNVLRAGFVDVRQGDLGAFADILARDLGAKAAGRTGDDGDLALQSHGVSLRAAPRRSPSVSEWA